MRRFGWIGLLLWILPSLAQAADLPTFVESRAGRYPFEIPAYTPSGGSEELVTLPQLELPPLPQWQALFPSQYEPPEPGWFDSSGKRFHVAYRKLFSNNIKSLQEALKDFYTIQQEEAGNPTSDWYGRSLFWSAQAYVRIHELKSANQRNTPVRDLVDAQKSVEALLNRNLYELTTEAQYTKAWLLGRQGLGDQALEWLEATRNDWATDPTLSPYFWELEFLLQKTLKTGAPEETLQLWVRSTPTPKALLFLAQEYYQQQQWEALRAFVDERFQKDYNAPIMKDLLQLRIAAEIQEKRWDAVEEWVGQLEKHSGTNDWTQRIRGRLALQQEQWDTALEILNQIRDPQIRIRQAQDMVRSATASQEFGWILRLTLPVDDLKSWEGEYELLRAYALFQQGRNEAAYDGFKRAEQTARTAQTKEWATFFRLNYDLRRQNWDAAWEENQALLAKYPESPRLPEYFFWNAVLVHQRGQSSRFVLLSLRQIPETVERADDRLLLEAALLLDQEEWGRAISLTQELEQTDPESPLLEEALLFQAQAQQSLEKPEAVLQLVERIRQEYPEPLRPVRLTVMQAKALLALERAKEADPLLVAELKPHPVFELAELRVRALQDLGQDAELVRWSKTLPLSTWTPEQQAWLYEQQADALYRLQRWEDSRESYLLAMGTAAPERLRPMRFQLLLIAQQLEQSEQFLKVAQELLAENETDSVAIEVLERLVAFHVKQGHPDQAAPYLRKLAAHYEQQAQQNVDLKVGERVELFLRLGQIHQDLQQWDQAERWMSEAEQANGASEDDQKATRQLRILKERGQLAFRMEKHSESLAANLKVIYLDRSLSTAERFEVNRMMAESYWALKRPTEARAVYKKMLREFEAPEWQQLIQKRLDELAKP